MEKNYRIKKHPNDYSQNQALEPFKKAPDEADTSRTDIKRARKRAAISICLNFILAFGKSLLVGRWLLGLKPDQVAVAEIKEGTAAVLLKEAGVELILAKDPASTEQDNYGLKSSS